MIPSVCFLNFADSWICTWVLNYSGNIFNLRKSIISLCIFARGYNKSITMRLIDFAGKVIEMIILIIYFIFDFDGTDIHRWQDRRTNVLKRKNMKSEPWLISKNIQNHSIFLGKIYSFIVSWWRSGFFIRFDNVWICRRLKHIILLMHGV